MFATISADIVSSTSLSVNETIGLKQRIESLFSLLKVSYPDFEGRQIKGDYIECVMQNVSNVFRIYNRGIQMYRFPNSDVQKSVIFEGIKKRLKIV